MIRKLFLLLCYLSIPIVAAGVTLFALKHFLLDPKNSSNTEIIVFEVPENSTLKKIARDLQQKDLIGYDWAFTVLAKVKRKETLIMAGEYELSPSMTPEEILTRMVSGKTVLRRFTVKEGDSAWEIAPLLAKAGILTQPEFEAALTSPELLQQMQIAAPSFEGYLFPQTYQFPRGAKPAKIISAMLDQLNAVWEPDWDRQMMIAELTKHKVITLASIVEKESGDAEEHAKIASVFFNRLKKKMRLQSDPTVIYGIPNFNGNLTKEDLTTPSAYNTYVIDGLPPGPIANPGESAIRAVIYPAQTEYLYFVGNGNGKHVFSKTLEEHNAAVNLYQKQPAKEVAAVAAEK